MKTFMDNTKSLSKKKENVQEQPVSDTATNLQQALSSDSSLIPVPFIFIKSDLRLVIDLQTCIKAQQSEAYAQKVKLTNLKQMAQTVAYIQEHGYDTRADFNAALTNAENQTSLARKKMKDTEQQLKNVNEQIHFTGQYLAYKAGYQKNISGSKRQKGNSIEFCLVSDCFLFHFGEKQSCTMYERAQVKITLTGNEHLRKKLKLFMSYDTI